MREEAVSVRDVVTITIVWLPGGGLIRHNRGGAGEPTEQMVRATVGEP
jgi:hypothetical protein